MRSIGIGMCLLFACAASTLGDSEGTDGQLSPMERYVQETLARAAVEQRSPGSLFAPGGMLGDVGRDLRAARIDDIVTVVVSDRASAVSRGTTNTARSSAAKSSILSLFGSTPASGGLANLANLGSEQQLEGQGQTSRTTVLTTTISARVTHLLPNGNLVIEGFKDTWINSERQQVSIRGIVRWNDLDGGNRVSSDRLANLEVRVNGKGVVGDAIRRPNILFRILLGLLPF